MCFIAFLLERTLQLELKKKHVALSIEGIRDALASAQVSVLSDGKQQLYLASPVTDEAKQIFSAFKIPLATGLGTTPPI